MYRLLERDPENRLPAAVDQYERGVSLSGISKAFGMPGIRIGWLAMRDAELMRRLQTLHDYSTICSSAPSEVCLGSIQAKLSSTAGGSLQSLDWSKFACLTPVRCLV